MFGFRDGLDAADFFVNFAYAIFFIVLSAVTIWLGIAAWQIRDECYAIERNTAATKQSVEQLRRSFAP